MTAADTPRLATLLNVLAEAFNEPVSAVRMDAYFLALSDLSIESLEGIGKRALNLQFFPRPADLRRLIEGTADHEAELAWLNVLREIRRVGYTGQPMLSVAALETIHRLWGGWTRVCQTLPGEGPELIGWAKQFHAAYQATSEQLARPERIGRAEAKQIYDRVTTPRTLSLVPAAGEDDGSRTP